ncbi:MAG TPA: hypothetical protein VHA80_05510 [Solirubrobacterales bacterium]|nr:hypothetical protein [Solirubrobacterales bacterium]
MRDDDRSREPTFDRDRAPTGLPAEDPRRDRAALALGAYLGPAEAGGRRPTRPHDREHAEDSIAELLCDLHHLADELDLDWSVLEERGARYRAEETARHVVEVTGEGFQILDSATDTLRADVWGSRPQAQGACDELNGSSGPRRRGDPR